MEDLLYNPVYNALNTGDAHQNIGKGEVKYFDEEVSPFAGFHTDYKKGFEDLHDQIPGGRAILYATPEELKEPNGWSIRVAIKGLQFVFDKEIASTTSIVKLVELNKSHAAEMVALAALTKPGPFGMRTIEFGHYYGVIDNGKLVAMTGQRLHVENYSEVSAVCTHPDHLGKGYGAALIQNQLEIIQSQGKIPFLHVRADNERAIDLYERLGFYRNREMNFYFMKRVEKDL